MKILIVFSRAINFFLDYVDFISNLSSATNFLSFMSTFSEFGASEETKQKICEFFLRHFVSF